MIVIVREAVNGCRAPGDLPCLLSSCDRRRAVTAPSPSPFFLPHLRLLRMLGDTVPARRPPPMHVSSLPPTRLAARKAAGPSQGCTQGYHASQHYFGVVAGDRDVVFLSLPSSSPLHATEKKTEENQDQDQDQSLPASRPHHTPLTARTHATHQHTPPALDRHWVNKSCLLSSLSSLFSSPPHHVYPITLSPPAAAANWEQPSTPQPPTPLPPPPPRRQHPPPVKRLCGNRRRLRARPLAAHRVPQSARTRDAAAAEPWGQPVGVVGTRREHLFAPGRDDHLACAS